MKGNKSNKRTTSSKSSSGLSLVIDTEVNERDEGIFYLLPSEMSKSGLLNPERFDSCDIRNVEVDDIRPSALLGILSSLKPNGTVSVTLCEPIAVMQPYEARMVEANAKLAGFTNIKTGTANIMNEKLKAKMETITVILTK